MTEAILLIAAALAGYTMLGIWLGWFEDDTEAMHWGSKFHDD